jgi:hypothetical protein
MGYWGYFVVGRGERPLAEGEALSGAEGMTLRERAPDGWQVWEYPGGDDRIASMNDLAAETGAPALFGYVMDSAGVVVEAAAPDSGAWTTCLNRAATARHLGAGEDGLSLERTPWPKTSSSGCSTGSASSRCDTPGSSHAVRGSAGSVRKEPGWGLCGGPAPS